MLLWGDCLRDLVHMLPLHRGSRYSDNTLKSNFLRNYFNFIKSFKLIYWFWKCLLAEGRLSYLFYDSSKTVWTVLRQGVVGPQWSYIHCPLCLSFRRFLNFRAKFLPNERIRIYAEMSKASSIFCCDLYYYLDPLREPIPFDIQWSLISEDSELILYL